VVIIYHISYIIYDITHYRFAHTIYDIWYMYHIPHMIYDIWYITHNRCPVESNFNARFAHIIYDIWLYMDTTYDIWHMLYDIWYQVPSGKQLQRSLCMHPALISVLFHQGRPRYPCHAAGNIYIYRWIDR